MNVAFGVKRTCLFALQMSAYDPSGHAGRALSLFSMRICTGTMFVAVDRWDD
jgi:hypothetical protein